MDLSRRKPLDQNETLDPSEGRKEITTPGAAPLTWDEAVSECRVELERARRLVEYLETMTAQFEKQVRSGTPWPEEE
jgi:hypothetical protein